MGVKYENIYIYCYVYTSLNQITWIGKYESFVWCIFLLYVDQMMVYYILLPPTHIYMSFSTNFQVLKFLSSVELSFVSQMV